MPRLRRFVLPGVALHAIQRGNNRTVCFRETSDYLVYLMHLKDLAAKMDCAVHAYCLMTNHVHLLITPASLAACIGLMRNLGQRYAQYFNRHHGRTGTLWEGRFRSCITESPEYVLACHRYIELNPVRAGMVCNPREYRWSSHAMNAGLRPGGFVDPHPDVVAFGGTEAYARLFDDDLEPAMVQRIREAVAGGYPLCSESFKETFATQAPRRLERSRGGRPLTRSGERGGNKTGP